MKNFEAKKNTSLRFIIPAALFTLISVIFVIVLAVIQIRGGGERKEELTVRTVTVQGLRGEIYDCNGKLLVGNSTTYDIVFEYGAMPDTRIEVNKALLSIVEGLEKTGNADKLASDEFVLVGSYPSYKYTDRMNDTGSEEYKGFLKVAEKNGLEPKETSAKDLVDYITSRYGLSEERYSNAEISSLIRIYYEMERLGFGAYQSYTVAEDVSTAAITYVNEARIEGATVAAGSERYYAYPGIASHILGRVGKISAEDATYYSDLGYPMDAIVGTDGCEKIFEDYLRGKDGEMVIEYDKEGNIVNKYYKEEAVGGNDIYLTIDIDVQIAAEKSLAESVKSIDGATGGAVTVMNANDGSVLAIASYPTYDVTRFYDTAYVDSLINDPSSPFLNRALNENYAPGSTYKLGVAIAALEEGVITPDTTYECHGVYPKYDNPECTHTDGITNVTKAIQNSCNIFFYSVLDERFSSIASVTDYTKKMGLGVSTGIEFTESTGTVAGPAFSELNHTAWGKRDDLSAAIGQSDHGYTPLQLSVYTSTIANGGTRYSAHLLDSVRKFYTGEVIYSRSTEVADRVSISSDVYAVISDAMGRVITENTVVERSFASVPVQIGGKTGTSQVTGKQDYAVFTAFAPLDSPEIVASCVIEQGRHGYNAAVPVGKVFEAYFNSEDQ